MLNLEPAETDFIRSFVGATGPAVATDPDARDRAGAADMDGWRAPWAAIAKAGGFGLAIPKESGGAGLRITAAVAALEALGRQCPDNGLLLAVNAQIWPIQMPLLEFGSPAQKARLLPALINGTATACHAVTEDAAGSDAMALATRAVRDAGGYRLEGEKALIGMAPVADVAMVFASTDPDKGAWGVSAFLVNLARPGVTRGAAQDKMGMRSVPFGGLTFDGVRLEAEDRLGPEGAGAAIFRRSLDWERRFILSSHCGGMARALDDAIRHARTRAPGGVAINTHQAVTHRLADMRVRYEAGRALLYRAAAELDAGEVDPATGPLVKLALSEAFLRNAEGAMRIYGGAGYLSGSDAERNLRDAMATVTYGGTSDIQRNLIAGLQRGGLPPDPLRGD